MPNGFAFLVVVSPIFVINGACDESDKIVSDKVSHEVAYVHHRSVILPAEPSLCDAFLFSAADQLCANKVYTVRSILSESSAHDVGRDKSKTASIPRRCRSSLCGEKTGNGYLSL